MMTKDRRLENLAIVPCRCVHRRPHLANRGHLWIRHFSRLSRTHSPDCPAITANTGCDGILFMLQIGVQEAVAEMAHRQARCDDVVPEALVTAIAGDGSEQLVGTPSEMAQLFGS